MRADAQMREDLLRSTQLTRSEASTDSEKDTEEGESNNSVAESPVLLPEQRVALYATVRRQYMEMNRAKAQNSVWRGSSKSRASGKARSPLSNASIAAAVQSSRDRRADQSDAKRSEDRKVTSAGVKIVDVTSGCEARVHRQTNATSTPWRKRTTKAPAKSPAATEHERFLRALQAQLETPPLCSCAKGEIGLTSASHPCANNCALYKQPRKREKLLTSVYKQQQLDKAAVAAPASSPSR